MSIEPITAGLLALRGLGMLTRLLRRPETQQVAERLRSGEPVSEAEFSALIAELLEAAEAAGESDTHPMPGQRLAEALNGQRDELSSLLFDTLDVDASGAIDGNELLHMERLVSRLQRLVPPGQAAALSG